jgi:hypothetical protein
VGAAVVIAAMMTARISERLFAAAVTVGPHKVLAAGQLGALTGQQARKRKHARARTASGGGDCQYLGDGRGGGRYGHRVR